MKKIYRKLKRDPRIKIKIAIFLGIIFFGSWLLYSYFGPNEVAVLDGLSIENQDKAIMEKNIREMVKGYPIEKMVPYIVNQDPKVAAFLVSIAKKESNWGKRVPVLNGQDCYNYWGYRGIRDRMGTGGHTCFDSPQDAVETVAQRIQNLIDKDIDTPQEMLVWKCGSSCVGHNPYDVKKWVSDIALYFKKIDE